MFKLPAEQPPHAAALIKSQTFKIPMFCNCHHIVKRSDEGCAARRRSGPSSPNFVAKRIGLVVAHLERCPAPRNGRLLHVRPMSPHFRPWRAKSAANGPPRTEMRGAWPHVGGSAVSRRRAPLEVRSNKLSRRNGEFRRGRPATPTRRAPLIRPFYNMMTVREHSDFESLTFVNKKYRRDKV